MNFWGFKISETRSINYDANERGMAERMEQEAPSSKLCIGCGGCTAGCTAGALTEFNIRRLQMLAKRGEEREDRERLGRCMLCGKCLLVCPRGVETRKMILSMMNYIKNNPK